MKESIQTSIARSFLLAIVASLSFFAMGATHAYASTLLSDTFSGTTIDGSVWNVVDTAGTNVTQNNQLNVANSYVSSVWGNSALYSKASFSRGSTLTLQATMVPHSDQLLGYGDYNFNSQGTEAYIIDLSSGGNIYAIDWENGVAANINLNCGSVASGAIYKLVVTGTGFDVDKNTGTGDVVQCSLAAATTITNKPVFLESSAASSSFQNLVVTNSDVAGAPATITTLVANSNDGQVELSWGIPSDNGYPLTGYVVQYRPYGSNTWLTFSDGVGTSTASTASTTVTGLSNGTRYEFNVYAVNSVGNALNSNNPNTYPMGIIFQDTFDGLNTGSIGGQNGWLLASSSFPWNVTTGNGGKDLTQSATYGNDFFFINQVTNSQSSWGNSRAKVDLLTQTGGIHDNQIWIRKTTSTGDGGGYFIDITGNTVYLLKHTANSGASFSQLTAGSYSFADNTWYTIEIESINDPVGNVVLKAYIYPRAQSRPDPILMYTDSSSPFSSGYVALGTDKQPSAFDNLAVYGISADAITITSPSRSVVGSSTQATLAITDESGVPFYIPYIQTSQTLSVSAAVGPTILPSGGGVEFVLNQGSSTQQVVYSIGTPSPFSATFSGLPKGSYTVDTYVVNSLRTLQTGTGTHDQITGIGIGDIVSALGDSITEGFYGNDFGTTTVTDWTNAPAGSVSRDGRNFPQYGPTSHSYKTSYLTDLNNELESYYGYPVFIMNEGWGGFKATDYITLMATSEWANRQAALHPNKWLIHLGTNDGIAGVTPSTFQSNMQTIINSLETNYSATGTEIWLAKPNYSSTYTYGVNYLPIIDSLRTFNGLAGGPDFWTFYQNHNYYSGDPVHPNVAGDAQMARLWAISMMSPTGLSLTQTGTSLSAVWNSLSSVDPTIAGYKLYYGTSASALTHVVDEGNTTAATISSGLTSGQTYFAAIQGYDNDVYVVNPTATSSAASVTYGLISLSITLNNPASGSTVSGPAVLLTSTAFGSARVNAIQFKVDGVNIGPSGSSSPYSVTWDSTSVSDGSHVVSVTASDVDGGTATSSVGVIISNAVSSSVGGGGASSAGGGFSTVTPTATTTPAPTPCAPGDLFNTATGTRCPAALAIVPRTTPLADAATFSFTKDLYFGAQDPQVKWLQEFLNGEGYLVAGSGNGSPRHETTYFGLATRYTLKLYQAAHNIIPAAGYFGPITRRYIASHEGQ
jgi:lysophospholipase L1-like esterase